MPVSSVALVKALEKLSKGKKAKHLANAFGSMEKIAEKSDELTGFADALNTFNNTFAPLAMPLQMVSANMSADIIDNVIKLMGSFNKLLKTDVAQGVVAGFTKIVELLIDFASWMTDNITDFLGDTGSFIDAIKNIKNTPWEESVDNMAGMLTRVQNIFSNFDLDTETMKTTLTTVKLVIEKFIDGFVEAIKDFARRLGLTKEDIVNTLKVIIEYLQRLTQFGTFDVPDHMNKSMWEYLFG